MAVRGPADDHRQAGQSARGRPLPVLRALRLDSRDCRQRRALPVRPLRRVLRHLHGGGGPRLGYRACRGRPRQDDVPVRDAVRPRLRVGRARAARYVRPDSRGSARPPSPGASRRLAQRAVPVAQGFDGLPFPPRPRERHGKLRIPGRHQGQGDYARPHGTAAHHLRRARPLPPVRGGRDDRRRRLPSVLRAPRHGEGRRDAPEL